MLECVSSLTLLPPPSLTVLLLIVSRVVCPLSHSAATDCLQSSLQQVMSKLDSTLTELEGTRTSNMLLKQQVKGRQAQRGPVLVLV